VKKLSCAAPLRERSFQILEGEGECIIDDKTFYWNGHDTIACPTFAQVIHRNTSMRKVACLLQVDDGPPQSKLGFYEEEPLLGA
jgi:gentisate 1,2-dioxygenase